MTRDLKTKTAIEQSIADIKDYVKSLDTPDNIVYAQNELLIMSCFAKAMEILESNMAMEKHIIQLSWIDGKETREFGYDVFTDAENYFNKKYAKPISKN